jgi:hypothetical protein
MQVERIRFQATLFTILAKLVAVFDVSTHQAWL